MYDHSSEPGGKGVEMADRMLLLALLANLETELRELDLWEMQSPTAAAFDSQLPFYYDTMNFNQWLQWVFVARFRALLETDYPLPGQCDVVPMAEEYFKQLEVYADPILALLKQFDDQFPS